MEISRQLSAGARVAFLDRRGAGDGRRRSRRVGPEERQGERVSGLYRAAIAGGLLGTVVMTTMLRAASELGITRMDLPFLLGTAVTDNRRHAKDLRTPRALRAGDAVRLRVHVRVRLGQAPEQAIGFAVGAVHASLSNDAGQRAPANRSTREWARSGDRRRPSGADRAYRGHDARLRAQHISRHPPRPHGGTARSSAGLALTCLDAQAKDDRLGGVPLVRLARRRQRRAVLFVRPGGSRAVGLRAGAAALGANLGFVPLVVGASSVLYLLLAACIRKGAANPGRRFRRPRAGALR